MACNPEKTKSKRAFHLLEESPQLPIPTELKEFLSQNNECYVLITCGRPSKDGKMNVEMTYEGDACLAAYLLESAQEIIDDK